MSVGDLVFIVASGDVSKYGIGIILAEHIGVRIPQKRIRDTTPSFGRAGLQRLTVPFGTLR